MPLHTIQRQNAIVMSCRIKSSKSSISGGFQGTNQVSCKMAIFKFRSFIPASPDAKSCVQVVEEKFAKLPKTRVSRSIRGAAGRGVDKAGPELRTHGILVKVPAQLDSIMDPRGVAYYKAKFLIQRGEKICFGGPAYRANEGILNIGSVEIPLVMLFHLFVINLF